MSRAHEVGFVIRVRNIPCPSVSVRPQSVRVADLNLVVRPRRETGNKRRGFAHFPILENVLIPRWMLVGPRTNKCKCSNYVVNKICNVADLLISMKDCGQILYCVIYILFTQYIYLICILFIWPQQKARNFCRPIHQIPILTCYFWVWTPLWITTITRKHQSQQKWKGFNAGRIL